MNKRENDALDPCGPNAAQIQYWSETAGPRWVAHHETIAAQVRSLGMRALDRAAIAAGSRVLDVGCGCGESTLEIARRVGPGGAVMGVDVSAVMLARAEEAARAAALENVTLTRADAQTAALPASSFDALFSRLGVMFFSDPEAAFANLRRALRPGARMTFLCWRAFEENPWMLLPAVAAARHIPVPQVVPGEPGPFAFADADRVHGILERAGFEDLVFEEVDEPVQIGGDRGLEAAVDSLLQFGLAAKALREAGPGKRDVVRSAIREAIAPCCTPDGVRLRAAAWIVRGATG